MKTNLITILWKKEKKHWRRTSIVLSKFNNWIARFTLGLIFAIIVSIAHYGFAIMHTLYELFLWVFFRKTFKSNLQKLALKI